APTADPKPVSMVQNQARERESHDRRNRQRGHEQGDRLGLFSLAKPVGEIQDDAGEESSFSHTEKEAQHVDVDHPLRKAVQHGNNSPTNQNPCNPDAWSNLVQHQVAGYFKEEIAEEEYSKEQSKLLAGDCQLLVHRQGCNTDVDPVKISNDVQDENVRD